MAGTSPEISPFWRLIWRYSWAATDTRWCKNCAAAAAAVAAAATVRQRQRQKQTWKQDWKQTWISTWISNTPQPHQIQRPWRWFSHGRALSQWCPKALPLLSWQGPHCHVWLSISLLYSSHPSLMKRILTLGWHFFLGSTSAHANCCKVGNSLGEGEGIPNSVYVATGFSGACSSNH